MKESLSRMGLVALISDDGWSVELVYFLIDLELDGVEIFFVLLFLK